MRTRRVKTGTGHVQRMWPVLALLLAAVLVPSACVLWFMARAIDNERLAARQRLVEQYRGQVEPAREAIDRRWRQRLDALTVREDEPPAAAFSRLAQDAWADAFAVYDAGAPAYPDVAPPAPTTDDPPAWQAAEAVEFAEDRPLDAAAAYAALAAAADDPALIARAMRAQARCLAKAGRPDEAIAVVLGPLSAVPFADALDEAGRLVVADARLFALELLPPDDERRALLAQPLAVRLADYTSPMSSRQRRFLHARLAELGLDVPLPALPLEAVSAAMLARDPSAPAPALFGRLGPVGDGWRLVARDGRAAATLSDARLRDELAAALASAGPMAGTRAAVEPPGAAGEAPFIDLPLAEPLGGWRLAVRLEGDAPFAAAAERQVAAYLWTAGAGVSLVAALAILVARHVGRQMRLTRLKNDLIATVSHELKTPLSSMRVLVDTLLEGRCEGEAQAREYLALIARENLRLSRLIDNFLAFSRMERGKVVLAPESLDPAAVAREAADAVAPRFEGPGRELRVEVAPGLPAIRADHDAMVTVLLNLLDNAHKYTRDEKRVALRVFAEGGEVCFAVQDNGIGLSRRAAGRVFERFYQADRTLSGHAGGVGLGLAIVKYLVTAGGGRVAVRSESGRGSTFTVRLPAAETDGAAGAAATAEVVAHGR